MFKRIAVLLSLGLCLVIALQVNGDFLRRLRARHVKETIFVSAGYRRLAGFFDGLRSDPHWNAAKFRQTARVARECGASSNGGLLTRLTSLFERTAHAQSSCSANSCAGQWQQDSSTQCAEGNCSNLKMTLNSGDDACSGNQQDGTKSCDGSIGCSPQCTTVTCQNSSCGGGGGGCVDDGGECDETTDCCSGSCFEGECSSVEIVRRPRASASGVIHQ